MPKKIKGGSVDWGTPSELFDKLNAQYGFDIDLCSNESNKKCGTEVQQLENFDQELVYKVGWINPPFSKIRQMLRIALSLKFPVVGIYRCDNLETETWQDIIFSKCDWVLFLKGRVRYEDPVSGDRTSPMFPSALFGKGVKPPEDFFGKLIKLTRIADSAE